MSVKIVIKPNTYFDSVSLMSISTRANKLDGVEQAFVAMATEMNKGVLKNLGLLAPETGAGEKRRPDDCHQRQSGRRQRAVAGGD